MHGGSDDSEDFNTSHLLNLRTMIWSPAAPSPEPATGHTLCTLGDNLVLFGGWRKDHYSKDTMIWDWKTGLWIVGNGEEMNGKFGGPWARRDHTMTMADMAYVFGGWNALKWTTSDQNSTEVWRMDNTWHWNLCEVFGESPRPRRGHSTTYDPVTNTLLIFAGVYGYSRYLSDMFILKLSESFWESVTYTGPLTPTPRAYHSASLLNGRLFVFGGLMSGDKVTAEMLVFGLESKAWERLEMDGGPGPRCGHCALTVGESIVILGGMTSGEIRCGFDQIHVFETSLSFKFSDTLTELCRKTKMEELEVLKIIPPPIPPSLQKSRFYKPKTRPYDIRTFPKVS